MKIFSVNVSWLNRHNRKCYTLFPQPGSPQEPVFQAKPHHPVNRKCAYTLKCGRIKHYQTGWQKNRPNRQLSVHMMKTSRREMYLWSIRFLFILVFFTTPKAFARFLSWFYPWLDALFSENGANTSTDVAVVAVRRTDTARIDVQPVGVRRIRGVQRRRPVEAARPCNAERGTEVTRSRQENVTAVLPA